MSFCLQERERLRPYCRCLPKTDRTGPVRRRDRPRTLRPDRRRHLGGSPLSHKSFSSLAQVVSLFVPPQTRLVWRHRSGCVRHRGPRNPSPTWSKTLSCLPRSPGPHGAERTRKDPSRVETCGQGSEVLRDPDRPWARLLRWGRPCATRTQCPFLALCLGLARYHNCNFFVVQIKD